MLKLNVKEIACETAHEFVDYIRLSKNHWGDLGTSSSSWLFRGQADSDWKIEASLFRKYEPEHWLENLRKNLIKKVSWDLGKSRIGEGYLNILNQKDSNLHFSYTYYLLERQLLYDFVSTADNSGFEVPELDDSVILAPLLISDKRTIPSIFTNDAVPGIGIESLKREYKPKAYVGLAQHHGIYTRLIDMTYNPLTAAYFAINNFNPQNSESISKRIVVWAVNTDIFKNSIRNNVNPPENRFKFYNKYSLPRTKNQYLQRQDGVFVYPEYPYEHNFKYGYFPPFEDYLSVIMNGYENENLLRKITLPYNQMYNFVRILEREGLSKVKMMPTLDNVTESLKNKWMWELWADKNLSY